MSAAENSMGLARRRMMAGDKQISSSLRIGCRIIGYAAGECQAWIPGS